MLLTIDVGNTNTSLGVFDGDQLAESWRVKTDPRATGDELSFLYRGLLEGVPIDGVVGCSTVPSVLHELREMLGRFFRHVPTLIVEPGVRTGVAILTDTPREVGTDRIMNTLAAHHLVGGPALVVDFGTSTNFDVVSADGEFLGGLLAPGIEISVDALAARGAQLRKVELTRPRSVIGKNTVEALQAGILYGFAGQVDGIVRRVKQVTGEATTVVATGGLATLVLDEAETIDRYEPWLTLIGLRLAFERHLERGGFDT